MRIFNLLLTYYLFSIKMQQAFVDLYYMHIKLGNELCKLHNQDSPIKCWHCKCQLKIKMYKKI